MQGNSRSPDEKNLPVPECTYAFPAGRLFWMPCRGDISISPQHRPPYPMMNAERMIPSGLSR